MKFTGKNDVFFGLKFFGCFEKHPKVVSGALRDGFRAREVFGSFEKRTPGTDPLHDPVIWCGINYAGKQIMQWKKSRAGLVRVHLF